MTHIHSVGAGLVSAQPIREFGSLREFDGGCPLLQFVMRGAVGAGSPRPKSRTVEYKANLNPPLPPTRLLNPPILPTETKNPVLTLFNSIFKCYVGSLGVLRSLAKRITDSPNKNATPKYTAPAEFPKTQQCSHKLPNSQIILCTGAVPAP